MKSMSKRNKIILVTGSLILLLAAVVAVVFSRQGGTGLFGSGVRTITPANPSLAIGQTVELVVDAVYNCDWSSSDPAVISFVGDPNNTKRVTVQGNLKGQSTITAQCAGGTHGTTNVAVPAPITPHTATLDSSYLSQNKRVELSTEDPDTRWTWSCLPDGVGNVISDYYLGGYWIGPSVTIGAWTGNGRTSGGCDVSATTRGFTDTVTVTIVCTPWQGMNCE
jgi:hypothetical protein